MLNIYWGGERTDKERFIFEHIKGRTLLIVPDQFSLQAERDAFFYLGEKSLMDLRIVDFSALGHKVIRQTGGRIPKMIDKYGRHMLLTRVMRLCDDDLKIYSGFNWKNSFIENVNGLISEMKRYEVSPEDLRECFEGLDENSYLRYKLEDIFMIYTEYQKQIEGKYLDSEDYISFYSEKILSAPMVAESEIWIYGFDTFTPKNLTVVESLLKASRGVNVVMTYEKDREIFDITKLVMGRLTEAAQNAGHETRMTEIPRRERKTVWSAAGAENGDGEGAPDVTLVAASDMHAEAERAAAYILELVRDKDYRFGDIMVVCNDADTRGGILKRTFTRWGIPVFMDRKRKVLHHRAVGFLLAIVEAAAGENADDAMIKLVKSGLLGFEDSESEMLENYVKQFGIRGSKWKADFTKTGDQYDGDVLDSLNVMRKRVVDSVGQARERMGARNTAGEKIRGLYGFLEDDMSMIERLRDISEKQESLGLVESAAETAQSWNIICSIFDQVTETVGEDRISNRELIKLLTAGFEEIEIGLVPASSDNVLIGTMQRTRASRIKALLVVGANEGILPLGRNGEGIFSEREKETLESLDLDFSKRDEISRQEEQLALYRMFCLPEERLYVSCCGIDEKGEELRPSVVFEELKDALDIDSVSVLGDLGRDDISELIVSKEGTLSYLADALRDSCGDEEPDDGWYDTWLPVMKWYERNYPEGFKRVKKGMLFDNRAEAIGRDLADSLFRGDRDAIEVSASRLEKYSGCPFSHFIMYGLRAEEPRLYEMGAREIGDIYHRCLMRLSEELTRGSGAGVPLNDGDSRWMTVTEEECAGMVRRIIREDADGYREGLPGSGRAEEYRTERIAEICGRIAWAMVRQVRAGRIKEMRFEYPFGSASGLPPVKVDAGGRQVFIQGKIDRVDIIDGGKDDGNDGSEGSNEAIRIVDYKTGGDTIDPEYFRSGYKLQLMIYLKAALESSRNKAEPAGVFYFKIKDMDFDADKKNVDADGDDLEKMTADAYRLEGIVLNDESLINAMDEGIAEQGSSHVIPVRINKKDGQYAKTAGGHLMSKEAFGDLYGEVERQVQRICGEICDGNIDIRPKMEKTKSMDGTYRDSCRYCGYRSICMFDTSFEGCGYELV